MIRNACMSLHSRAEVHASTPSFVLPHSFQVTLSVIYQNVTNVIHAATYPLHPPSQYHENQQYLHPYISPVVASVPLIIQKCDTGLKE